MFSNTRKQELPAFHFPVSFVVTEASPKLFLTKEPCEKSNSGKCKAHKIGACVCVCVCTRACVKDLLCAIKEKQPREQGKDKTVCN